VQEPSASINVGPVAANPPRPELALLDKPSIAVLPFANLSGDPKQEYFADGMVEEIITVLTATRTPDAIRDARGLDAPYRAGQEWR
jgi:TolB-like protein